jgi:hypothetical protein
MALGYLLDHGNTIGWMPRTAVKDPMAMGKNHMAMAKDHVVKDPIWLWTKTT